MSLRIRSVRVCKSLLHVVAIAVASVSFSAAPSAHAANGAWTNTGATGDWNTNSNWNPATSNPGAAGTATGNTDAATFGLVGTVAHTVTDALTNRMIGGIIINGSGTGGNYTIGSSANTLYINQSGSITFGGTNSSTIASNLMMTGANLNSSMTSTGTLTLSGTVSSSAASGTSRFSVANNNAADVVLVSGNVVDGSSAAVAMTHGAGVGILLLTGVNTYTGGFVNGGGSNTNTTRIGVDSVGSAGTITSSAFGTGTLALNQGQISSDGATARTIYNALDFRSGINIFGDAGNNGALTFTGAITSSAGLSITLQANSAVDFTNPTTTSGTNQTLTLSGDANGSIAAGLGTNVTGLTKSGTGTWTLSGAATSTAATTINDGTLRLGINNALKSTTNLTVNAVTAGNTATLDLGGFNQQLNLLTLGGAAATATSANRVTNSSGTSVLTVNGVTYTATNNPLGAFIAVNTLDLNGAARTFSIGDSANAAADLTISSAIQNGGINKSGAGALVLSGANTYTGTTSVSGGALLVTGSITGTLVNVNSTGTLGGTGVITTTNQAVTLLAGGKLSPGTDAANSLTINTGTAQFNISAGVTAANSQSFAFDLDAVAASDRITMSTGTLNIGTGVLEFDDFVFSNLGGLTAGTYTLFQTTNTITGSFGGTVSGSLGSGFTGTLEFADGKSDIVLTVVPEPRLPTLLLVGLGMLRGFQRRRQR